MRTSVMATASRFSTPCFSRSKALSSARSCSAATDTATQPPPRRCRRHTERRSERSTTFSFHFTVAQSCLK